MQHQMMNHFNTVEDFISDESFQNFVLKQDTSAVARWKAYQKSHPEHQELITEASLFVNILAPQDTIFATAPSSNKKKYWYSLALISCFLILFSIWYFSLSANVNSGTLLTKHAEAENLSLIFPDQTEVELREGSTIKYYEDWSSVEGRKLWLEGEAYFNVEKSKKGKGIFEVQLENGLIRVLGTKFLVKSNQEDISVVLEEGQVECLVNEQTIMMKPGDFLSSRKGIVALKQKQKIRTFDSWRAGKLSFKNVSIEEVISTINNSYPINISLGNPLLKDRKITATVDQNDPLLLLNAIAAIYDIELIEEKNKVILK